MKIKTNNVHRYTVKISGEGGEFSFVPMTREQADYWLQKGTEALADHLRHGDNDGVPWEFALGCYWDFEASASGIELTAHLTVEDERGNLCYGRSVSPAAGCQILRSYREVVAPKIGAFFRTYERAEQSCELQLSEPFDHKKLQLRTITTPNGELVNGFYYKGEEISELLYHEKNWQISSATLFT